MVLVLAEKPSVARDISRVLGACEEVKAKDLTWYENDEYIVSSFLGHLVTLAEPEMYQEKWGKPWKLESLPIFPEFSEWKFMPVPGMNGRLNALKKLMNDKSVTEIICATDAGREGEVIFRYVYDYLKCAKPYKRLWISSLTDDSIIGGFNNLLSGTAKESLYLAGYTRSRVDWLVGMNLSRIFSIYNNKYYSVGRVQTPLVNMICQRDADIANFKKQKYYTLTLQNGAEYIGENEETHIYDKGKAETIRNACVNKTAKIIKAETRKKSENRPLLYSLTLLQKEANEKHGFSAARTLTTMQELYEKKLLTYPRTDSNYITEDMIESVSEITALLFFFSEKQVKKLFEQGLNFDKRIADNKKVR